MAVPTFGSVTPSSMSSRGRSMVTISGTNFRVQDPVPATGYVGGEYPRPVTVSVGGEPCEDVRVWSATTVTCIIPSWRGDPNAVNLPATADVVITNVDDDGVPIPTEAVTAPDAFTYFRDALTYESPSRLNLVTREVIFAFRRYVLKNTKMPPSTETFDATSGVLRLVQLADLPGLILMGPRLTESPLYTNRNRVHVDEGGGTFTRRRRHYVVDLEFELTGVSDRTDELLNLADLCTRFIHSVGVIEANIDPGGPTPRRKYDVMWVPGQEPEVMNNPSTNNLRTFEANFRVMGVDIDTPDVLERIELNEELAGADLQLDVL